MHYALLFCVSLIGTSVSTDIYTVGKFDCIIGSVRNSDVTKITVCALPLSRQMFEMNAISGEYFVDREFFSFEQLNMVYSYNKMQFRMSAGAKRITLHSNNNAPIDVVLDRPFWDTHLAQSFSLGIGPNSGICLGRCAVGWHLSQRRNMV